jgi:predicted kinase
MRQSQLTEDVRRLRESLGQLPEPMIQPPFIVVSGLPGTGKSHFSRKLSEKMPLAILVSDSLRKLLFSSPNYTQQESSRLFQACHQLIEELLKEGIPLVLDATNLEEYHRERLYHIAAQLEIKLIIVRIEAPPEVVYQRLEQRQKGPVGNSDADWKVYQKMKPTAQHIRRNHFKVDTSKDITPVIDKIVREANR